MIELGDTVGDGAATLLTAPIPRPVKPRTTPLNDEFQSRGVHPRQVLAPLDVSAAFHRVFTSSQDVLIVGANGGSDRPDQSGDCAALSHADGLLKASAASGQHRHVVVVVGDDALTDGLGWEALSSLGAAQARPAIVVLSDDCTTYDPTSSAVARHLRRLRGRTSAGNLFEDLGFGYFGPIDGHDAATVEEALRWAHDLGRPAVLHCVTRRLASPPIVAVADQDRASWRSAFGAAILEIGRTRGDVVCAIGAHDGSTEMRAFAERFPDRVFDLGLGTRHAVTSAAGLAMGGLHPVVTVPEPSVCQVFGELLADVSLRRLGVTFVIDRVGMTDGDGSIDHGILDSSILPIIPGVRIAVPRDAATLRESLLTMTAIVDGPTVVRIADGAMGPDIPASYSGDRYDVLRHDPRAEVLLVAVGPMATTCLAAAVKLAEQGVPVTVVDPRWIMPLSSGLLGLAARHRLVLAVEDTVAVGALGSRLAQELADIDASTSVVTQALPNAFQQRVRRDAMLHAHGLDAEGIATAVLKHMARR